MSQMIGFPRTPFEFEIAFANFGVAIMIILAVRGKNMTAERSNELRLSVRR